MSTETQNHYAGIKDYIGNLMLLRSEENLEKLNQPFEEWIKSRDSSFKKRHLIPDDTELYKFENFEAFVVARDQLIKNRLQELFGYLSTDETQIQEPDQNSGLLVEED